jgi:hypothetical protein
MQNFLIPLSPDEIRFSFKEVGTRHARSRSLELVELPELSPSEMKLKLDLKELFALNGILGSLLSNGSSGLAVKSYE